MFTVLASNGLGWPMLKSHLGPTSTFLLYTDVVTTKSTIYSNLAHFQANAQTIWSLRNATKVFQHFKQKEDYFTCIQRLLTYTV